MSDEALDYHEIDKDKLDEECVRQPKLYYRAAMELAEADAALRVAKSNLKLTEAELSLEIRADPAKFRLPDGKVTEKAVELRVLLSKRYKKALDEYNQAAERRDVCNVSTDTADARKYSIRDLVQLRLADYFSEPSTGAGKRVKEDIQEREKKHARSKGVRKPDED